MAKERYMYGTVLCQKNSDGEKYFINLKTGDKVTVSEPYKHLAKIVLVADEITKGDVDRAQQLFDEKKIEVQHIVTLKKWFESQKQKKLEAKGQAQEMAEYIIRSSAYMDIIYAIQFAFMPWTKEITYYIPLGGDVKCRCNFEIC